MAVSATLAAVVAAALVAGPAVDDPPATDDLDLRQARDLLTDFDQHWRLDQLDELMSGFSPFFGCNLLGNVNGSQLRATFERLLERFPESRCHTEVIGLRKQSDMIQAMVCRKISGPDAAIDELCHVIYLRKTDGGLIIVGLEEYSHEGLRHLRDDAYTNPSVGLKLLVPPGMFAVATPTSGFELEHLMLRGDDLRCTISIRIEGRRQPIDLRADSAAHIDRFRMEHEPPQCDVELDTATSVAGFPGWRSEITYQGDACSLRGRPEQPSARTLVRVTARLDERYLLHLQADAPAEVQQHAFAAVSQVVESLAISRGKAKSYESFIERSRGWGRVEQPLLRHPPSGLRLVHTDFQRWMWAPNQSLIVHANSVRSPEVRLALEMHPTVSAPDCNDAVAQDDAYFIACARSRGMDPECESSAVTVGGVQGRLVERIVKNDAGAWYEAQVYFARGYYLGTLRTMGPLAMRETLRRRLTEFLDGIRFD